MRVGERGSTVGWWVAGGIAGVGGATLLIKKILEKSEPNQNESKKWISTVGGETPPAKDAVSR